MMSLPPNLDEQMSISVDEYFLGPALVGLWHQELADFFGKNPGHKYEPLAVMKSVLKINWDSASEVVAHVQDSWAIHTALNQLIGNGTIRLEQGRGGVTFYKPKPGDEKKEEKTQQASQKREGA